MDSYNQHSSTSGDSSGGISMLGLVVSCLVGAGMAGSLVEMFNGNLGQASDIITLILWIFCTGICAVVCDLIGL